MTAFQNHGHSKAVHPWDLVSESALRASWSQPSHADILQTSWAHLDIAGAAWDHKAHHATGFGAQTLAEWAISQGQ